MLHQEDNRNREIANKKFKEGLRYFDQTNWKKSSLFLKNAAESLIKIKQKNTWDYHKLVNINYNLGNSYLNDGQLNQALTTYLAALACYQHMDDIEDKDYRLQVELYINCCDAYFHLKQFPEADKSLNTAIEIHQKIQQKTSEELMLGHISHNPRAFYEYYEKRTSFKSFLTSSLYRKQVNGVEKFYHQNRLDNLCGDINNVHVQKNAAYTGFLTNNPLNQVTTQLNQLSFSQENNNDDEDRENTIVDNMETTPSVTSSWQTTPVSFFYYQPATSSTPRLTTNEHNQYHFTQK